MPNKLSTSLVLRFSFIPVIDFRFDISRNQPLVLVGRTSANDASNTTLVTPLLIPSLYHSGMRSVVR